MPKIVKRDPEEMQAWVDDYFATTKEDRITVTGLAMALNFCNRSEFAKYCAEVQDDESDDAPELTEKQARKAEIREICQRARLRVENVYEMRLNTAKPVGAIFALKNMGWRDNQEIMVTKRKVIDFTE